MDYENKQIKKENEIHEGRKEVSKEKERNTVRNKTEERKQMWQEYKYCHYCRGDFISVKKFG